MWAQLVIEPDEAWKKQMKSSIEDNLSWMVRAAERDLRAKLSAENVSGRRREALIAEHLAIMACIRGRAEEQFQDAILRERVKRQWVSDYESWNHALLKAQQAMLDAIEMKKLGSYDAPERSERPSLAVDWEREPSTLFKESEDLAGCPRQPSDTYETNLPSIFITSSDAPDRTADSRLLPGSTNMYNKNSLENRQIFNAHIEPSSSIGLCNSLDQPNDADFGYKEGRKTQDKVDCEQATARSEETEKAARAEGKRKRGDEESGVRGGKEESVRGDTRRIRREKRQYVGGEGSVDDEESIELEEECDAFVEENLLEHVNERKSHGGREPRRGELGKRQGLLRLLPGILDGQKRHTPSRISLHVSQKTKPTSVALERSLSLAENSERNGFSFDPLAPSAGLSVSENSLIGLLEGDSSSKEVLSPSHEEVVQNLVNTLYSVKRLPLGPSMQEVLTETLFKVAKDSGRYPQQLLVDEVVISGNDPVGVGGFSDVYRGTYQGEVVAVKRVRLLESDFDDILKDCARELVVWSCLSHENILPLRGVFLGDHPSGRAILAFISPFKERGDLSRYLRSQELPDKYALILDIINGIVYLHSQRPPVIHGDIKPTNILISATGRACIGDYGLSYIKNSARRRSTSTAQGTTGKTLQYSAPELMDDDAPINRGRDIFAFGCLVFEMYSGKAPYSDLKSEASIVRAIMQDKKLTKPNGIEDCLWNIVEKCRAFDQMDRPSADQVLELLRGGLQSTPLSTDHV